MRRILPEEGIPVGVRRILSAFEITRIPTFDCLCGGVARFFTTENAESHGEPLSSS
jgi:hypothetical protein